MSKFTDALVKFYNDEKEKESPASYVKSIKKLLDFYGIETE
jgi:hypothetical protein